MDAAAEELRPHPLLAQLLLGLDHGAADQLVAVVAEEEAQVPLQVHEWRGVGGRVHGTHPLKLRHAIIANKEGT